MKLADINWDTLTQQQARLLVPAADKAEQFAARRLDKIDGVDVEREWERAFAVWEDLRVFAITGVNPRRPF